MKLIENRDLKDTGIPILIQFAMTCPNSLSLGLYIVEHNVSACISDDSVAAHSYPTTYCPLTYYMLITIERRSKWLSV
jgi:sorbitol-specific phosphotransferase system component IIC